MDGLDFRIIRWLSSDGTAVVWGGRRAIDPRLAAGRTARMVGVSETAVRARIRGLREVGLDGGTEVVVHPHLFGATMHAGDLPLRPTDRIVPVLDRLGAVGGVVYARCMLDDAGRRIRVFYVSRSRAEAEATASAIRSAAPSGSVVPAPDPYLPPCTVVPSPGDWAFLRAMYLHPHLDVSEFAALLGLSPKTASRRFHRLVDGRACWYSVAAQWEGGPWAVLVVRYVDARARTRVERFLAGLEGGWLPTSVRPETPSVAEGGGSLVATVLTDGMVTAERTVRALESIDGVLGVARSFTLESRSYRGWCADRLDAALDAPPGFVPGRAGALTFAGGAPATGAAGAARIPFAATGRAPARAGLERL
jgi:DNA-binding Lrp family transcriptional regulator